MSMQLNVTSYLLVITITVHNEIRQKKRTKPYTHICAADAFLVRFCSNFHQNYQSGGTVEGL